MTDTDALTVYLRQLERIKDDWDDRKDIGFVTLVGVKFALDLLNLESEAYTPRVLNDYTPYTLICNTNRPEIGGENAEIEKDCLLPLWQLCRRMQETEQDIYAFIFGTEHELAHIDTDIYF